MKDGPVALPGLGTGPRGYVPPDEQAERRKRLRDLIVEGRPRAERVSIMAREFAMNDAGVARLQAEILAEQKAEDAEVAGNRREIQAERILNHIRKALVTGNHGAISRYEELLAKLHGTETPTKIEVDVRGQVTNSILALVGGLTEERLAEMIERRAARLGVPVSVPLLTQGTPVEAA